MQHCNASDKTAVSLFGNTRGSFFKSAALPFEPDPPMPFCHAIDVIRGAHLAVNCICVLPCGLPGRALEPPLRRHARVLIPVITEHQGRRARVGVAGPHQLGPYRESSNLAKVQL